MSQAFRLRSLLIERLLLILGTSGAGTLSSPYSDTVHNTCTVARMTCKLIMTTLYSNPVCFVAELTFYCRTRGLVFVFRCPLANELNDPHTYLATALHNMPLYKVESNRVILLHHLSGSLGRNR